MSAVAISVLASLMGLLTMFGDPRPSGPAATTAPGQDKQPIEPQAQQPAPAGPVLVAAAQPAGRDPKFGSAEDAYRVGVAFHNAKNHQAARAPLEAALRMADDDDFRLKVYEALLPSYRAIPEHGPFVTAAEFIIAHSPRDAQRSLTRRALLSFAYNRGQLDNLAKRYEDRLAKDHNDKTAVYVLSELYSGTGKNPRRAVELLEQLAKMEGAEKKPAGGGKTAAETAAMSAKTAREKANLARQYVQTKQYRQAAQLYEEIAPLDPATSAWNTKEAAAAWLKAGNKKEALRLALQADQGAAEARNEQLAHFFHRNLADILMAVGRPDKAVGHYRAALEKTKIEGYVKDTRASLQQAQEAASKMK